MSEEKQEQKKSEPAVNYDPKKQSHVWVYSIKRKFASDIEETLGESTVKEMREEFKFG